MMKDELLRKYYSDLKRINDLRRENDTEELSQRYRDKLFQIKYLIRYGKVIEYDYE